MGNSSTKESRSSTGSDPRSSNLRQTNHASATEASSSSQSAGDRLASSHGYRGGRRHDVSFFGLGGISDSPVAEIRRETKQERDVRRAERDRVARLKERERSLKEEGVDGGYVVTLGTYTGPEDFSKSTVRRLMVERRIAPFWRGLNDHSDSWTEHQLVAAARGKPIPAPDEIPLEEPPSASPPATPSTKPIAVRSPGSNQNQNDYTSTFFSSHLNVTQNYNSSSNSAPQTTSPLFRGRSRTLVSMSSKNDSQTEVTPPEIKLPYQPQINGQPVEAYLYKDVLECPICFLYYPPYLNRTRCCDQPICSECFVQIKRPDPHPPEHLDPNSAPSPEARRQEEEGTLLSEPASCPFCVQTEFGVTYEAPPFRRGLAYANQAPPSAAQMSPPRSSPANGGVFTRRRGQSVSANDNSVITTDRVRPDWAKKLADARAQAARRSAAATALHSAAYMMSSGADPRTGFGRRRRYLINADTPGSSDDGTLRTHEGGPIPNMEMLMAALEGQSSSRGRRMTTGEVSPSRFSSRASRTDELEELMMMEAIRLSLAAEEDRKKKEEKESAKEAKKEEKKKVKEQKKADKVAKKQPLYSSSANASSVLASPSSRSATPVGSITSEGKGKTKAFVIPDPTPSLNSLGFNLLNEPTSTLNMGGGSSTGQTSSANNPQRHLEKSRANLDTVEVATGAATGAHSVSLPNPRSRLRQLSDASSSSSSFVESPHGSVGNELTGSTSSYNPSPNTSGHHLPFGSSSQQETPTSSSGGGGGGGSPTLPDSMFNFGSLAAMIGNEEDKSDGNTAGNAEHVEQASAPTAASNTEAEGGASLHA